MNEINTDEAAHTVDAAEQEATDDALTSAEGIEVPETPDEAQTFERAYVEKLRKEAAEARTRAKRADDLARELFVARVAATGRLADPTDLPFDDEALSDPAKMSVALDTLLANKPHLASRRPHGDIGQGAIDNSMQSVDLAGLLRARA